MAPQKPLKVELALLMNLQASSLHCAKHGAYLSGTVILSLNSPASKAVSGGPCSCTSIWLMELDTGSADMPGGGCFTSFFSSFAIRDAKAMLLIVSSVLSGCLRGNG